MLLNKTERIRVNYVADLINFKDMYGTTIIKCDLIDQDKFSKIPQTINDLIDAVSIVTSLNEANGNIFTSLQNDLDLEHFVSYCLSLVPNQTFDVCYDEITEMIRIDEYTYTLANSVYEANKANSWIENISRMVELRFAECNKQEQMHLLNILSIEEDTQEYINSQWNKLLQSQKIYLMLEKAKFI